MIVLRILGVLLVLAVGGSVAIYVFTRDKRWLRFAWQILKLGLIILLIIMALFLLERL